MSDVSDVFEARKKAIQAASDAASAGDPIAGMLADLENLAQPFYLGLDCDEDDSDLWVWP
jgi:hypothetical protein